MRRELMKEIKMECVTAREGKKIKALGPDETKQNTSPGIDLKISQKGYICVCVWIYMCI